MKKTSFLKRQPTEKEYKRGKSEAIVLGAIIGVAVTLTIEYFFNIKIPALIKWFLIVGGFSFLSQKFLSKHLGKKITFQKQNQEHNKKSDQKIIEIKNIDDRESKKGLIWTVVIIITVIFIGTVFSNLFNEENIKLTQTDKSNDYSVLTGNMYRNTKYNFRIKFPDGWKIGVGDGIHIVQKASFENSTISVMVQQIDLDGFEGFSSIKDAGISKEFVDTIIKGAKEKFSDVKIINYGETKIDNEPTYWVEYSANSQILDRQLKMTNIIYYIAKGNTMYSISAGTATDEYLDIKPLFTQTVGTFALEDY